MIDRIHSVTINKCNFLTNFLKSFPPQVCSVPQQKLTRVIQNCLTSVFASQSFERIDISIFVNTVIDTNIFLSNTPT